METTLKEIETLRGAVQASPHPTVSLARDRVLRLLDLAEKQLHAGERKIGERKMSKIPIIDDVFFDLRLREHAAYLNFDWIAQKELSDCMERCKMEKYPPLVGSPDGEYADGDMVCAKCVQPYAVHPMDWRVIGYGDRPFLQVLCDGRRVKL